METIDLERAKFYAKKAIDEKGADYIYEKPAGMEACAYFDCATGAPSCIVGHVLTYAGLEVSDLQGLDFNGTVNTMSLGPELALALKDQGGVDITPEARRWLRGVQRHQDASVPWGRLFEQVEIASGRRPSKALHLIIAARSESENEEPERRQALR